MHRFSRRIVWLIRDNGCLLEKQETLKYLENHVPLFDNRGVSRTRATSKMELFVTLVNDFQPLTNATRNSILAVSKVLDPSLGSLWKKEICSFQKCHAYIFGIFVVAESLY